MNIDNSFSTLDLAKFVNVLAQSKYCDLDEDVVIRDLINAEWPKTQSYQLMFFLVYLVGYLVPFFLQIFSSSYVFVVIANVSCFLSVITLFVYEFV